MLHRRLRRSTPSRAVVRAHIPILAVAVAVAALALPPVADGRWEHEQLHLGELSDEVRASSTTVAVLDTGAELVHPQLSGHLWWNTSEPLNGVDDDHNGYSDDRNGANIQYRNGNVVDDHGHGTQVAGVLNGVAPNARVIVIKVLDADKSGTTLDVADGVRYAIRAGAKIINISAAGSQSDPNLSAAVVEARAADVLVVAATGNDGADLASAGAYPAESPGVLAVAATDSTGQRASFSNYGGPTQVAAPGDSVGTLVRAGGQSIGSGTSFSTPAVAGVAALLRGAEPNASADAVERAILLGARRNDFTINGTVDAAAAYAVLTGREPQLSVTGLKARRSGRKLRVTWQGSRDAERWTVRVRSGGQLITRTLPGDERGLRLTLPRRAKRARVSLVGDTSDGADTTNRIASRSRMTPRGQTGGPLVALPVLRGG